MHFEAPAVALGATFLCLGARRHGVPTPRRGVRVARRERGKQGSGSSPLNVLQEKAEQLMGRSLGQLAMAKNLETLDSIGYHY